MLKKLSNSIKIEKDEKYYILHLSCDLNFISMKFRIDKPFKFYEKHFQKSNLKKFVIFLNHLIKLKKHLLILIAH